MTTLLRAIVVIPTYNEEANIELLLRVLFRLKGKLHILVVDDNSPDGTADLVRRLQKYYPRVLHLLRRPKKEGLGRAYLAGFTWALRYSYDYICSMDGDFSHAPIDLLRLLNICVEYKADIVIGSRYIEGGCVVDWPFNRIWLSRLANWFARLIIHLPIKDTTSGFVCYRAVMLKDILHVVSIGYSFQIEIKFLAHKNGAKIIEIPITFINRTCGSSKMNLKIAGESFLRLFQMKWRS